MDIYKSEIDEAIEIMEKVIAEYSKYPTIFEENIWHLNEAIDSLESVKTECKPYAFETFGNKKYVLDEAERF